MLPNEVEKATPQTAYFIVLSTLKPLSGLSGILHLSNYMVKMDLPVYQNGFKILRFN